MDEMFRFYLCSERRTWVLNRRLGRKCNWMDGQKFWICLEKNRLVFRFWTSLEKRRTMRTWQNQWCNRMLAHFSSVTLLPCSGPGSNEGFVLLKGLFFSTVFLCPVELRMGTWTPSTPGALPLRSFFTTSVFGLPSQRWTWWQDYPVFLLSYSNSPPKSVRVKARFPFIICQTVHQNLLEAKQKLNMPPSGNQFSGFVFARVSKT